MRTAAAKPRTSTARVEDWLPGRCLRHKTQSPSDPQASSWISQRTRHCGTKRRFTQNAWGGVDGGPAPEPSSRGSGRDPERSAVRFAGWPRRFCSRKRTECLCHEPSTMFLADADVRKGRLLEVLSGLALKSGTFWFLTPRFTAKWRGASMPCAIASPRCSRPEGSSSSPGRPGSRVEASRTTSAFIRHDRLTKIASSGTHLRDVPKKSTSQPRKTPISWPLNQ
jgi:hypothetical protein